MIIAFLLLLIGLGLVFAEFYLPGAILGCLGGLFIGGSILYFSFKTSSLWAIVVFSIAAACALVMTIRCALWAIVKAKPGSSIYSNQNQEGFQASDFDRKAIGRKGIVLSDLKPGGYIVINGIQHQALSFSGYLSKGTEVEVIGGQEDSLIVKLHTKDVLR